MFTQDIWNQFSEALKKFIFSKVKDVSITKDILQDVFMKIHTKKDSLKNEDSLKSWIFTIANNTIYDYFKNQKKSDIEIEKKLKEIDDQDHSHQPADCILPLILNLPKKYREVLLLTTIKGVKQSEAAQQLNISLPATKSRVLRGRELLKQGFIDCCNYSIDENGHLKGEHKNIDECKICNPNEE